MIDSDGFSGPSCVSVDFVGFFSTQMYLVRRRVALFFFLGPTFFNVFSSPLVCLCWVRLSVTEFSKVGVFYLDLLRSSLHGSVQCLAWCVVLLHLLH